MGKKSKKTTTKVEPWGPGQQHILGAANAIRGNVAAQQPHLDEMAGNIRSYLPGLAEKAFAPDAGLDAAKGYAGDVLGGKYLSGNPYLSDMIGQTQDSVMNRVNSAFGRSGRSLSGNHVGVASRELADAENRLRYGDYDAERGRMGQMTGLMPGLTQAEVARVAPYLAASQTAANIPFAGTQHLGQIGSMMSPYSTQTSTQSGGWGTDLLNAGAQIGSAFIAKSDIRAKKNIAKVGELNDGLGIYEYEYRDEKHGKGVFRGVMAQEVASKRPWALGPIEGGYMTVDYSKLGEAA